MSYLEKGVKQSSTVDFKLDFWVVKLAFKGLTPPEDDAEWRKQKVLDPKYLKIVHFQKTQSLTMFNR